MNGHECGKGRSAHGRGRMRGLLVAGLLVALGTVTALPFDASAAVEGLGPKQLWDKGNDFLANNLYRDAVDYYTGAIRKNKGEVPMADVARIFNSRGLAFLGLKDTDRALTDFSNAMELDEKNPEFVLNRGRAFLDLGKDTRAIEDFSAALAMNPGSAAAFAGRAKAYQGTGEHDKAIADLSKLLELEPNSTAALYGMGISYKAKQRDERAIEAFDRLLKIEPNHAAAAYQKAGIYARANKIDAACVWLESAVAAGFRDWDTMKNDHDFDAFRKNSCYQRAIAGK